MAFEALPFSIVLTLLLVALVLALQNMPRGTWRNPSYPRSWNRLRAGIVGFTIAASGLAMPGSGFAVAENVLAIVAGGLALVGGVQLLGSLRLAEG